MTIPFFRGFDRYDLWTAALVCRAMNFGSPEDARAILNGVEPWSLSRIIKGTATEPRVVCAVSDRYVFVAVSGTDGFAEWVGNVVASVQAEMSPIPGAVGLIFGSNALAIWTRIKGLAEPNLPGRYLVLMGHSLGGAIVQCLLPLMADKGQLDSVAFVFGCPRVGNQTFANAVAGQVYRVENTDDPIPALPPGRWPAFFSIWSKPAIPPLSPYVHGGQAKTCDAFGVLTDGGNGVGLDAATLAFSVWDAPTHGTEQYVLRLSYGLQIDPIPPAVGYADDASLVAASSRYSPVPATMGVLEMGYLTQGIMYFRSNSGPQEGWEESVYFDSDVDAVLSVLVNSLIPARTAFLSNQAEIHAYRAARADGVRFSRTRKPLAPFVGQTAIPVNEYGDCIEYTFRTVPGSDREWPFRGVADSWIDGSKVTGLGIAGSAQIDVFGAAVIANGGSLKIPSGLNSVTNIAIIANEPAAGGPIQITTVAPHNLTSGNLITLNALPGFPYLRGQWRVQVVDALNFKLVGSARYHIDLLVTTGKFQKIEYVASPMFNFGFNVVSFRKTGVPFGQRRGKQSAVVLHH